MSDIFRILCQDITDAKRFGICDDKPHQRACIDTIDGRNWMTVIENDLRHDVTFTALDNCIEIRKDNGKMESRCEGIITYNYTIIFLEIKDRTGGANTWAKDADKQLKTSIALIELKVDLGNFLSRKAYISNRIQRGSKQNHPVRIKQFLEQTGYILRVNSSIVTE